MWATMVVVAGMPVMSSDYDVNDVDCDLVRVRQDVSAACLWEDVVAWRTVDGDQKEGSQRQRGEEEERKGGREWRWEGKQ